MCKKTNQAKEQHQGQGASKCDCQCHLIEYAVLEDSTKAFRAAFFEGSRTTELYDFLVDAYALFQYRVTTDLPGKFHELVTKYVNQDAENSINVSEEKYRLNFLATYEEWKTNPKKSTQLYIDLKSLINNVQKLIYTNFSDNSDFLSVLDGSTKDTKSNLEQYSAIPLNKTNSERSAPLTPRASKRVAEQHNNEKRYSWNAQPSPRKLLPDAEDNTPAEGHGTRCSIM